MAAVSANGFPDVTEEFLSRGLTQTLKALTDEGTPERMVKHYDPKSINTGHSFLSLEPQDPDGFTPADFLAVIMLEVPVPTNDIIRRFTDDGPYRDELHAKIRALPNVRLSEVTEDHLESMEEFYVAIKNGLSVTDKSDRWVTASKLAARKRPDLFPLRDSVVCAYLDRRKRRDYIADWFLFRHIMRDKQVQELLAALPDKIHEKSVGKEVVLDTEPLRLLDVALWTYAKQT